MCRRKCFSLLLNSDPLFHGHFLEAFLQLDNFVGHSISMKYVTFALYFLCPFQFGHNKPSYTKKFLVQPVRAVT